jgi:hypothetical protein
MMSTECRATVVGPPFSPPDVTNASSTSGHSIPSGLKLVAGDHGVIPGGTERAEEEYISLVERFAAEELPRPFVDASAAGGVTATVLVRMHLLPRLALWTASGR